MPMSLLVLVPCFFILVLIVFPWGELWILHIIWSKLEDEVHMWPELAEDVHLQRPLEGFENVIPVSKYRKEKICRCCFCLCDLEEGDEFRELKCNHVFHKCCLDKWIDHGHTDCPLCRGSLATTVTVFDEKLSGSNLVSWF